MLASAPREAAPTDDYRGSDRGLTRGVPRVSGSRARKYWYFEMKRYLDFFLPANFPENWTAGSSWH